MVLCVGQHSTCSRLAHGVRLIEFVEQHPDVAPGQLASSCWPIALPGQAAAIWRVYLCSSCCTIGTGTPGPPSLGAGHADSCRKLLAINPLLTSSEREEQTGFASLLKGIFGMYRNPVAHDPRGLREVTDDELLELLTVISMAHRRLDSARPGSRKR